MERREFLGNLGLGFGYVAFRNYQIDDCNSVKDTVDKRELVEKVSDDYFKGELIKFALQHRNIRAITKGNCPEGEHEVHYFILSGGYDFDLDDPLVDLDLRLNNEEGYNCDLSQWPVPLSEVANEYFLGDIIWTRDII